MVDNHTFLEVKQAIIDSGIVMESNNFLSGIIESLIQSFIYSGVFRLMERYPITTLIIGTLLTAIAYKLYRKNKDFQKKSAEFGQKTDQLLKIISNNLPKEDKKKLDNDMKKATEEMANKMKIVETNPTLSDEVRNEQLIRIYEENRDVVVGIIDKHSSKGIDDSNRQMYSEYKSFYYGKLKK
jgi:aspartokinase